MAIYIQFRTGVCYLKYNVNLIMRKITENNKTIILQEEQDFIYTGGEGEVFGKGDTVYKLYFDTSKIPVDKIKELTVLERPNIIKSKNFVYENKVLSGISMDWIKDEWSVYFTRLMTNEYRKQNNFGSDQAVKVIEFMKETIEYIHSKNILIVDMNEMSFKVDTRDWLTTYFFDVPSYQTPNHKASAIAPGIRDYHNAEFSVLTDWYSFGVVSCYFLLGNHPFKVRHPKYPDKQLPGIIERMKNNVSIFNKDAKYCSAVRDFSVIPQNYLDWYIKLFEQGLRLPPPGVAGLLKIVPVAVKVVTTTDKFEMELVASFADEIKGCYFINGSQVVFTDKKIYYNRLDFDRWNDSQVLISPDTKTMVFVAIENNLIQFKCADATEIRQVVLRADKLLVIDNELYVISSDKIIHVAIMEIGGRIITAIDKSWNIMPNATIVYDQVLISNILGQPYLIMPDGKLCHQVNIKELKGYRVINARRDQNIVMIVGWKEGRYDRLVVKFNKNFSQYRVNLIEDVAIDLNFIVLDKGMGILINDDDVMEMFRSKFDDKDESSFIKDKDINGRMRLVSDGKTAMFFVENKLYRVKMK